MKLKIISILFFSLFITSCSQRKEIPPHYFVDILDGDFDLNYDIGNDAGIGRVDNVSEVGWTDKYVFAVSKNHYYWFDKRKDNKYRNGYEIVIGPITKDKFMKTLDSLEIKDFKFQYQFN